jgi:hypothetical protein
VIGSAGFRNFAGKILINVVFLAIVKVGLELREMFNNGGMFNNGYRAAIAARYRYCGA